MLLGNTFFISDSCWKFKFLSRMCPLDGWCYLCSGVAWNGSRWVHLKHHTSWLWLKPEFFFKSQVKILKIVCFHKTAILLKQVHIFNILTQEKTCFWEVTTESFTIRETCSIRKQIKSASDLMSSIFYLLIKEWWVCPGVAELNKCHPSPKVKGYFLPITLSSISLDSTVSCFLVATEHLYFPSMSKYALFIIRLPVDWSTSNPWFCNI